MTDNDGAPEHQIAHRMPTPIAVAYAEYQQERSVFRKLHRLVDVYETIMKYAAVLAIQNFYAAQLRAVFPQSDALIRSQIDRPSLGSWARFLEEILKCFAAREGDLFCRELYVFQYKDFGHTPVQQEYLQPNGEAGHLLTLRNELAHGATLSDDAAAYRLTQHAPDLDFLLEKAAFFADFRLFYAHRVHDAGAFQVQSLMGVTSPDVLLTMLTTKAPVGGLTNHLVVYNSATDAFLDLHPLLLYTDCEEAIPRWDQQHQLIDTTTCRQRKVLFYNDLKDDRRITFLDYQQGHHSRFRTSEQSSLPKTFRQRFPKPERPIHSIDWFDAFISDRTTHFVGRERELAEIDRYVAEATKAVLIVGEPGVGKSTLLGKWARDHQAVRHFIREGDAGTYKPIGIFDNLIRQVCERFGVEPINALQPDPLVYQRAFKEILQAATGNTKEPVVVVVDGLDEAVRSAFHSSERDPGLSFVDYLPDPPQLPDGVCLVVSTRPELLDQPTFAAKFGRDKTRHLTLGKLTEIEVRALLYQVRSKYDVLAAPEYVDAVVKQSEGNPLYLKMLVEDLAERQLVFGQTDTLPTGIVAYFKRILDFIEEADRARQLASALKTQRDVVEKLVAQNLLTRAAADTFLANTQSTIEEPGNQGSIEVLVLYCLAREPLALSQVAAVLSAAPVDVRRAFDLIRTVLVDEGQGRFAIFHSRFRDYVVHLDKHSDTRWQRYAEIITRVQRDLLAYCARWQEHGDSYALRHYAEHLQETRQLDTLYSLARDDVFRQAQADAFPNDPDLTLQTVQVALLSAAEANDAGTMAEFLWLHTRRLEHLKSESPLEALRAGDLQRSWELADLYDLEYCVLWHLLLAWELNDRKKSEDAQATLARLLERALPKLSDQIAKQVSQLFLWMPNPFAEEFLALQRWLLTDHQRHHLYGQLSRDRQFLPALTIVRDLNTWAGQAQALAEITTTAARVAHPDTLRVILEAALAIAQEIADPSARVQTLAALATTQAQHGDTTGAATTLTTALGAILKVDAGLRQEDALKAVLAAQAQVEDRKIRQELLFSAREIAQQLTPARTTVTALKAVAEAQAQADNVRIALDILATISEYVQTSEKDQFLAYAVAGVAEAQTRYGDHAAALRTRTTALEIVRDIKDEMDRKYALEWVISVWSQPSELTFAREIAQGFDVSIMRANALSTVATAFARSGDFSSALATVQPITDQNYRIKALIEIAELQGKRGEHEASRVTFRAALTAASDIGTTTLELDEVVFVLSSNDPDRTRALAKIAVAQARAGEFQEAHATALGIDLEKERKDALKSIALAQKQIGAFAAACETAWMIKNEDGQAEVLREISSAQAQAGDFEGALETARSITDQEYRTDAFHRLIAMRERAADTAALSEAKKIADELADMVKQGQALPPVVLAILKTDREETTWAKGVAQMQAGASHAARTAFAAAVGTKLRVKEDWPQAKVRRAVTLAKVHTQAQSGEFVPALETALRMKEPDGQIETLKMLAVALAQAREVDTANWIMETRLPRWQVDDIRAQVEIEKAIAEIRSARPVGRKVVLPASDMSLAMWLAPHKLWSLPHEFSAASQRAPGSTLEPYETWQGLTALAVLRAYAGDFATALDAIWKINEFDCLVLTLKAVLAVLAQIEQQETTHDGLSSAFDIACDMGNIGSEAEWHAKEALLAVAIAQAWAGLIADAHATAREINDPWCEAPALKAVALAQARAGLFAQAGETAQAIEDEQYRTQVLDFLATRQTTGAENLNGRVAFDTAVENRWGFLGEIDYYAARSSLEVKSLTVIASAQAAAGDQQGACTTLTAAFNSAWQIGKEEERAETLTAVAVAQVQTGFFKEAMQTTDSILVARDQHLPSIAEAFVEKGDREQFKQLLIPCAHHADSVPRMCGLLTRVYPAQAEALLQVVTRGT